MENTFDGLAVGRYRRSSRRSLRVQALELQQHPCLEPHQSHFGWAVLASQQTTWPVRAASRQNSATIGADAGRVKLKLGGGTGPRMSSALPGARNKMT